MYKKKIIFSFLILIVLSIFTYSCVSNNNVRPEKKVIKKEKAIFSGTNITSMMKIYGTGYNYAGVIQKEGMWQSDGLPPHYLILDGRGVYNGIVVNGISNCNRVEVSVKVNGKYRKLTNMSITNNIFILPLGKIDGDKIKLSFIGTNISVKLIELYGIKKGDGKLIGNPYMRSKSEIMIEMESEREFRLKNYQKAIDLNKEVIKEHPENPYPYMNLGQIYQAVAEDSEDQNEYLRMMSKSLENYEAADRADNPYRKELVKRLAKIYKYNMLNQEKAYEKEGEYYGILEEEGKFDADAEASRLVEEAQGRNITTGLKDWDKNFAEKMDKVVSLVESGKVDKNNYDVYLWGLRYVWWGLIEKGKYEKAYRVGKMLYNYFKELDASENSTLLEGYAIACMATKRWKEAIEAWKEVV